MDSTTLPIVFVLLLIVANGLFAMSELALVAARKARLKKRASDGDAAAKVALELAEKPSDFLATTQIGITLVGVLAGAYGAEKVADPLAVWLATIGPLADYATPIALALVVGTITVLSIVVGELVPKRLALAHAEAIARIAARPMRLLSRICAPLVHVLGKSTDGLVKLFGVKAGEFETVTDDEVRHLIDQGLRAGSFEVVERLLVDNVFKLSDRRVGSIMTPRADIIWLDTKDTPAQIHRKIAAANHARYIVADGDLDHVIGVVRIRDLLRKSLVGTPIDLRTFVQKPIYVPETLAAFKLLEMFKRKQQHVALVLDEYGELQGIVTIGDVFESIVGGIPDHGEHPEPDAVQRDDGSWLLDGGMDIVEAASVLQIPPPDEEDLASFSTLAGFIMFHLDRIPTTGEHFEHQGLRFEVVDMDGRRVDRVLASKVVARAEATAEEG
jgi:putative hemolysin